MAMMATRTTLGVATNPLNEQRDEIGGATVLIDLPMNEGRNGSGQIGVAHVN